MKERSTWGNGLGHGVSSFPHFEPLTSKEKNLLDLGPSTGGDTFANIPEPLIGKPLNLQYDRNKIETE